MASSAGLRNRSRALTAPLPKDAPYELISTARELLHDPEVQTRAVAKANKKLSYNYELTRGPSETRTGQRRTRKPVGQRRRLGGRRINARASDEEAVDSDDAKYSDAHDDPGDANELTEGEEIFAERVQAEGRHSIRPASVEMVRERLRQAPISGLSQYDESSADEEWADDDFAPAEDSGFDALFDQPDLLPSLGPEDQDFESSHDFSDVSRSSERHLHDGPTLNTLAKSPSSKALKTRPPSAATPRYGCSPIAPSNTISSASTRDSTFSSGGSAVETVASKGASASSYMELYGAIGLRMLG